MLCLERAGWGDSETPVLRASEEEQEREAVKGDGQRLPWRESGLRTGPAERCRPRPDSGREGKGLALPFK